MAKSWVSCFFLTHGVESRRYKHQPVLTYTITVLVVVSVNSVTTSIENNFHGRHKYDSTNKCEVGLCVVCPVVDCGSLSRTTVCRYNWFPGLAISNAKI